MLRLIEGIIALIFIFWLIGFIIGLFSHLIHIALIVIVLLVIYRIFQGKRTA